MVIIGWSPFLTCYKSTILCIHLQETNMPLEIIKKNAWASNQNMMFEKKNVKTPLHAELLQKVIITCAS